MASPAAFELRPRVRLHFMGQSWVVVALQGTSVVLRNDLGKEESFETRAVLQAGDFIPILNDREVARFDPRSVILDTYPARIVEEATALEGHLLEYRTGYRSGDVRRALPGEPRDEYNPGLHPLQERLEHKARELVAARGATPLRRPGAGTRPDADPVCSESERLRKLYRAYQKHGLIALIDKRSLRLKEGRGRHHPEVVRTAEEEVRRQTLRSNRTWLNLAMYVRLTVEDRGDPTVPIQSSRSIQRLLQTLGRAKKLRTKARTRRSRASFPEAVFGGLIADYPGQYVLIDVSPGDFLVVDPLTLKARRYKLVAAMDLYSRCILSQRLLPDDPAGIDLSFTVYDIITPKLMQAGWTESALFPYLGVPEHLLLRIHDLPPGTRLAGLPSLQPHCFVVDNGKIFLSAHFRNVCHLLGITLLFARPLTPTDKSQLERWFGVMVTGFAQHLESYVGSDVSERGERLEEQATHFVHEVQARLDQWIATVYHRRPHDGLRHASLPGTNLSPNDMFDLGMSQRGLIVVPLGRDIYYQLLETIDRVINDYGVEYMGMLYDHPELVPFRQEPSPFGQLKQRWPFKRDPRDPRYLYWRHPQTGAWITLTRRDSAYPDAPFSAELQRRAREIALGRGGRLHDPAEVSRALDELIRGVRTETKRFKRRREALRAERAMLGAEADRETVRGSEPMQTPLPTPAIPAAPQSGFTADYRSLDHANEDWRSVFGEEEPS